MKVGLFHGRVGGSSLHVRNIQLRDLDENTHAPSRVDIVGHASAFCLSYVHRCSGYEPESSFGLPDAIDSARNANQG